MRFIWFNLMPWPYLPEDFREKYRSVWVDIPSSSMTRRAATSFITPISTSSNSPSGSGSTVSGSTSTTPTSMG